MTHGLDTTFRQLGLSQYIDAFIDQGFDTWDTILDIQESDLDALGVKLGHRRKLQRRIANARGIAPSVSLASPLKSSNADETRSEGARVEGSRIEASQDGTNGGVMKRKYRRHPKPDENAPERPPSAYVLFSNKMREDLKSQNLTFTEIAKLVGENWQNLPPTEKEAYENQANSAKEKYHRNLMEYKKTPEYRKYVQYLHEFKEKQAKQHQADSSKRTKIEPARLRHGSSSSSSLQGATSSGGSSSERLQGSEPSPTRKDRMDSIASVAESHYSSSGHPHLSQRSSMDEPITSPLVSMEASPGGSFLRQQSHPPTWKESIRGESGSRQPLPSLSDMLDDGNMNGGARTTPGGFVAANHARDQMHSTNSVSQIPTMPRLRHEASSNGSSGSVSSVSSYYRTPGDGPVPIHTLLSDRSLPSQASTPASSNGMASPTESNMMSYGSNPGPRGYGFQSASSAFQNMKVEQANDGDVLMTSVEAPATDSHRNRKSGFDGMSALLRAGEIVSRHGRE